MVIIKHLLVKDSAYRTTGANNKRLDDLSKINIFIGSNNCGKSRFLRSIFQFKDNDELVFFPNDCGVLNSFYNNLDNFKIDLKKFLDTLVDVDDKNYDFSKEFKYILDLKKTTPSFLEFNRFYKDTIFDNEFAEAPVCFVQKSDYDELIEITETDYCNELNKILLNNIDEKYHRVINENMFDFTFKRVYIPILRGLRPFDKNGLC